MTTSEVEKLLPCPGCSKSDLDEWPNETLDASGANVVRCAWCHFSAPMKSWNRRAAIQQDKDRAGDVVAHRMSEESGLALRQIKVGEVLTAEAWKGVCDFVIEQDGLIERLQAEIESRPAQPAEVDAAMVERAALAYEIEVDGEVYSADVPRIAMRAALKAALTPTDGGSSG